MKPYTPDFPVQIPVKINAKSWKYSRRKIDSNLEASVCLQPVTFFSVPCSNWSQLVECFRTRTTINVFRIMVNVSLAKGRTRFLQSTVHAKSPKMTGQKTWIKDPHTWQSLQNPPAPASKPTSTWIQGIVGGHSLNKTVPVCFFL